MLSHQLKENKKALKNKRLGRKGASSTRNSSVTGSQQTKSMKEEVIPLCPILLIQEAGKQKTAAFRKWHVLVTTVVKFLESVCKREQVYGTRASWMVSFFGAWWENMFTKNRTEWGRWLWQNDRKRLEPCSELEEGRIKCTSDPSGALTM